MMAAAAAAAVTATSKALMDDDDDGGGGGGGREILNGRKIIELHVNEEDLAAATTPDDGDDDDDEDLYDMSPLKGQTGVCIKTRDVRSGRKVFLNVTHLPDVEKPNVMLPNVAMSEYILSEDGDKWTVPMHVGPLHYTRDKSGDESALVVEIVINTEYFERFVEKDLFHSVTVPTIAFRTIENKFTDHPYFPVSRGWELDHETWTRLTNKRRQAPLRLAAVRPPNETKKKTKKKSSKFHRPPPKHVADELERLMSGAIPLGKIRIREEGGGGDDNEAEADGGDGLKAVKEQLLKAVSTTKTKKSSSTKSDNVVTSQKNQKKTAADKPQTNVQTNPKRSSSDHHKEVPKDLAGPESSAAAAATPSPVTIYMDIASNLLYFAHQFDGSLDEAEELKVLLNDEMIEVRRAGRATNEKFTYWIPVLMKYPLCEATVALLDRPRGLLKMIIPLACSCTVA